MIFSIGHSTRGIEDFTNLLRLNKIKILVDVRSLPGSNRYPWFNKEDLEKSLKEKNIKYIHMGGLGGLRSAKKYSKNTLWKNKSFRGYADYMETPEFAKALDELVKISKGKRTVIMCAEAVPFKCHRSMISDALAAKGIEVYHITSKASPKKHQLKDFAKISKNKVYYYQ